MDRWSFVTPDTCQLLLCSSLPLFFPSASHLTSLLCFFSSSLFSPALLSLSPFCSLIVAPLFAAQRHCEDNASGVWGRRCAVLIGKNWLLTPLSPHKDRVEDLGHLEVSEGWADLGGEHQMTSYGVYLGQTCFALSFWLEVYCNVSKMTQQREEFGVVEWSEGWWDMARTSFG